MWSSRHVQYLQQVILKVAPCVQQILCLGIVYFLSVCALDGISNVATIDDLTSTARLVLTFPVALMDAVFILWVFQSLSKTLRLLQFRNATGKLQLYRRFTNALAAWVWVSIAWSAYELYSKVPQNSLISCFDGLHILDVCTVSHDMGLVKLTDVINMLQ